MRTMDGILLVHKLAGYTSQDVCHLIKKKLHVQKVGHCGTLDPFAEGLLIIGLNQGTKILPYLEKEKKTYLATLKLGSQTTTLDRTGEIMQNQPIPPFDKNTLEKMFASLIGKQQQIPPMYSAIKVNGKKLYEYARKNITIERKPREIEIYDLQLIDFEKDWIQFEVTCSKGTYIRTLGEEMAKKLHTVGHLTQLIRTRIGQYELQNAISIDALDSLTACIPIYQAVPFPYQKAPDALIPFIKDGKPLFYQSDAPLILWVNDQIRALAIYQKENENEYRCVRGFYDENCFHS